MVLTTKPTIAKIKAVVRQPAAPLPNFSTMPVTAKPIKMLVTTANIKRKEPSCTRSLLFLVISATREEYAMPLAV